MNYYSHYFNTLTEDKKEEIVEEFFSCIFTDFDPYRPMTLTEEAFIKRFVSDEIEIVNFYNDIIDYKRNEVQQFLPFSLDAYDYLFYDLCADWNAFVQNPKMYGNGIVVDMIEHWRRNI